MKTRVISGVIGLCILVAVLLAGKLVLSIAVSIICFMALYEFYKSISKAGYKPVKLPGYLSAFILAFLGFDQLFKKGQRIFLDF